MRLQEVVEQVSYVTTPSGQPTAVQVEIEVWQEIVAMLQQALSADPTSLTGLAFPEHPQRAAMRREIVAYEAMHSELVKQFLGQYVAIYQEQLVDHDPDPVALHHRIATNYADAVVLSRQVQVDATPVLTMRSPKLERIS